MSLIYFELPKLPKQITANNDLELWLSLFRAKTEEDLANLEKMGVPEMTEAINVYREITVTPEFREAARLREKARYDEAEALYHAEMKGRNKEKLEIAQALLLEGESIDRVAKLTALPREELEDLRQ